MEFTFTEEELNLQFCTWLDIVTNTIGITEDFLIAKQEESVKIKSEIEQKLVSFKKASNTEDHNEAFKQMELQTEKIQDIETNLNLIRKFQNSLNNAKTLTDIRIVYDDYLDKMETLQILELFRDDNYEKVKTMSPDERKIFLSEVMKNCNYKELDEKK